MTPKERGFQVRGTSSGRAAALLSTMLAPLQWFGFFARTEVNARCWRSLTEGDSRLVLALRARALCEFDDDPEVNFVTRGIGEIVGDGMKDRRVIRRLAAIFAAGVHVSPEEVGPASVTKEHRQAAFQGRLRKGRRRRALQVTFVGLAFLILVVAHFYFGT